MAKSTTKTITLSEGVFTATVIKTDDKLVIIMIHKIDESSRGYWRLDLNSVKEADDLTKLLLALEEEDE